MGSSMDSSMDSSTADMELVVVGGDSGVYSGWAAGGALALGADGRIVLRGARHLREYLTVSRQGAGSVTDLAVYGLGGDSPSVSPPAHGLTVLLGVRRAVGVSPEVVATFTALP